MGSRTLAVVGLVGSGLVGGLLGQLLFGRPTPVAAAWDPPLPAAAQDDPTGLPPGFDRFEQVARHLAPAVVSVDAVKPPAPTAKGKGNEESGSGVLVKLPGHPATFAVTNNHVVSGAR